MGLAGRLEKNERYQFLTLKGRVEARQNQARNYAALIKSEELRGSGMMPKGIFVDGELQATASARESLDWLAERALNRGSVVLVADFGVGKKIEEL